MASFFDPYVKIVLDGLHETVADLTLDVNVRLLLIRERD